MNCKIKKNLRTVLLFIACCSLLGSSFITRAEESWPAGPKIIGSSAIVMDVDSGTVLYEKNAHEQLYPASITKILTALLAIENSQMEEEVTFSYNSVHKTEGSGIWRDVGEVMTMEQCLYALMLNSANECAYAIAEHTGGTYEDFVEMMNDRAKALGCTDTHFSNPHGLTEKDHYTSCYDMALISREAIHNEQFRQITGTKRYDIPPTNKHPDEITYLTNHQKMLWKGEKYYYEYCIGGKTGYTEAAGNTLVTFAEKDGMTLVCVVMKEKPTEHYEDSIALLKYCFENFRTYNIAENLGDDITTRLPESSFLSGEVFADIDKKAVITLPVSAEFSDAKLEVLADTEEERVAGILQYTYAGRIVGAACITASGNTVEAYPFGDRESSEEQEPLEDQKSQKTVHVDIKRILLTILWIILGILALTAAGLGIYKLYDNFYFLRYKYYSGRRRNPQNSVLQRKRRRRRRR